MREEKRQKTGKDRERRKEGEVRGEVREEKGEEKKWTTNDQRQ